MPTTLERPGRMADARFPLLRLDPSNATPAATGCLLSAGAAPATGMPHGSSYAGAGPANALALGKAHEPRSAVLPPVWFVDAGPSLNTDFHVVGTLLNRAWVNGEMTRYEPNVQAAHVPAGGGGVFDVKIDKPGLYPFVSHSFAAVDLGQVDVLKVGDVAGTMSH